MGHTPELERNTEVLPNRIWEKVYPSCRRITSVFSENACNEALVLVDQSLSEESPKGNGERSIVSRGSDETDLPLVGK